ncbi:hypothetical protein DM77_2822 [Burkholderia mallei]|nr:hypothetical protein DM77_2822 [Burkholderia mallei]
MRLRCPSHVVRRRPRITARLSHAATMANDRIAVSPFRRFAPPTERRRATHRARTRQACAPAPLLHARARRPMRPRAPRRRQRSSFAVGFSSTTNAATPIDSAITP